MANYIEMTVRGTIARVVVSHLNIQHYGISAWDRCSSVACARAPHSSR